MTWSPTRTFISASAEKMTSVREPNLISPTRSPRSTVSPTFLVKTMRRASKPGYLLEHHCAGIAAHGHDILLVRSAEAAPIALTNFPFW